MAQHAHLIVRVIASPVHGRRASGFLYASFLAVTDHARQVQQHGEPRRPLTLVDPRSWLPGNYCASTPVVTQATGLTA